MSRSFRIRTSPPRSTPSSPWRGLVALLQLQLLVTTAAAISSRSKGFIPTSPATTMPPATGVVQKTEICSSVDRENYCGYTCDQILCDRDGCLNCCEAGFCAGEWECEGTICVYSTACPPDAKEACTAYCQTIPETCDILHEEPDSKAVNLGCFSDCGEDPEEDCCSDCCDDLETSCQAVCVTYETICVGICVGAATRDHVSCRSECLGEDFTCLGICTDESTRDVQLCNAECHDELLQPCVSDCAQNQASCDLGCDDVPPTPPRGDVGLIVETEICSPSDPDGIYCGYTCDQILCDVDGCLSCCAVAQSMFCDAGFEETCETVCEVTDDGFCEEVCTTRDLCLDEYPYEACTDYCEALPETCDVIPVRKSKSQVLVGQACSPDWCGDDEGADCCFDCCDNFYATSCQALCVTEEASCWEDCDEEGEDVASCHAGCHDLLRPCVLECAEDQASCDQECASPTSNPTTAPTTAPTSAPTKGGKRGGKTAKGSKKRGRNLR